MIYALIELYPAYEFENMTVEAAIVEAAKLRAISDDSVRSEDRSDEHAWIIRTHNKDDKGYYYDNFPDIEFTDDLVKLYEKTYQENRYSYPRPCQEYDKYRNDLWVDHE